MKLYITKKEQTQFYKNCGNGYCERDIKIFISDATFVAVPNDEVEKWVCAEHTNGRTLMGNLQDYYYIIPNKYKKIFQKPYKEHYDMFLNSPNSYNKKN